MPGSPAAGAHRGRGSMSALAAATAHRMARSASYRQPTADQPNGSRGRSRDDGPALRLPAAIDAADRSSPVTGATGR